VVCGVVGGVGNDGISEGQLPVYRGSYICRGSVKEDV
jgi:hypothetical protein